MKTYAQQDAEKMNIRVGDTFELDYPFKYWVHDSISSSGQHKPEDGWSMGCNKTFEQYDEGHGETFHTADGIGKIIFEVLATTEMPRKYKNRVLYKFDRITPDGKRINSSSCHTATIDKFKSMITNPYHAEYEVYENPELLGGE